jgi:hypothetical protein
MYVLVLHSAEKGIVTILKLLIVKKLLLLKLLAHIILVSELTCLMNLLIN